MSLDTTVGGANAESYVSVAEADSYFEARTNSAWAAVTNDDDKESALRKGTDYLENQYRSQWIGITATVGQALAWPRADGVRDLYQVSTFFPLYDIDGRQIPMDTVPVQVKRACMEAALLALGGTDLEPSLDRGGRIKTQTKTVGPLSKSVTYMDGASAVTRFTKIEGLLRGLFRNAPGSSNGIMRVVRG